MLMLPINIYFYFTIHNHFQTLTLMTVRNSHPSNPQLNCQGSKEEKKQMRRKKHISKGVMKQVCNLKKEVEKEGRIKKGNKQIS